MSRAAQLGVLAANTLALLTSLGCSDVSSADTTLLQVPGGEALAGGVAEAELAQSDARGGLSPSERALVDRFREGREIFRFETFDDQAF